MLIGFVIDIYFLFGYLCEHPPYRNALQKSNPEGQIHKYICLAERTINQAYKSKALCTLGI